MNKKGLYSHNSDDWKTPTKIYEAFMEKGYKDCFKYKSKENELNNLYIRQKLFINPPYSKMKEITWWLLDQASYGNKIALLIPARTDTLYFYEIIVHTKPKIIFIKGRLHFNDSLSAPFPSLLILINIYDESPEYGIIDQDNLVKMIKENF